MKAGDVTAVGLVESCLERIHARGGIIPEISPPRSQRLATIHQSRRSSRSKSFGLFIRVISHQRFEFAKFLCGLCALCG
jgi:hypothetical protein